MRTQTAIAEQIVLAGGDYVLALKGNQDNLHQQFIDFVDLQISNDLADIPSERLDKDAK